MKTKARKPPRGYFFKFVEKASGHTYESEMRRYDGLEWLYWESRRRVPNLPPDQKAVIELEEHHWLIDFAPRPAHPMDGVLPRYGLPLHARRSLSVSWFNREPYQRSRTGSLYR